ncbi:MAG: PorT family protein [Bacteroidales bacterium]|nr:PorT family protein [Bacteroidales bacterium]
MKKIVFTAIMLVCVLSMSAQDKRVSRVSGGMYVKGGLSWFMSDNKRYVENEKVKMSYGFGAVMNYRFTNNFALDISGGYSCIGGTANFINGTMPFEDIDNTLIGGPTINKYKYTNSYIELPIAIQGRTNEIGYFTYFLKLGATPMVRIKSKIAPDLEARTATKQTYLFSAGWTVGAGFEMTLVGNTRLLVEVDYLGTLTDLDKIKTIKDDLTELNPSIKINDVALKVGILF